MKGKVQTVLGNIEPSELGRVLPHEHLEGDIAKIFLKPPLFKPELQDCELILKNLGWIRQFPYSHLSNMRVVGTDIREVLIDELKEFKRNGGGTFVNNTTKGVTPKDQVTFAKTISREAGINVILGTGFYVAASQDSKTLKLTEELMAAAMTEDLTDCQDDTKAKCGIVGEIGCSWPLEDFERRCLRAAASVEADLGCPVMVHPGRSTEAPQEIVRIFSEAGGNTQRLVMAHLDRTLHTTEDILDFASNGTFLEYDLFGIETSYYQQNEAVAMPSDAQRIERILLLIEDGFEDKILISHDIHTRHRLAAFGGHGISHILKTVVPMMLKKGIPQEVIDKILIRNPANWLTFAK